MDHKSFEIFVPSRYSSLIFFPFSSPFLPLFFPNSPEYSSLIFFPFSGALSYDYFRESRFRSFEEREDSARKPLASNATMAAT